MNNVPHLGNIIGCVLSGDVFARYCRSVGYNCLYICGTDEYGTATEIKALEEGVTPKQVCDKYHKIHKEIYDWFGIRFDSFGRTSTEKHTQITQDIFLSLHKNGYIIEEEVEQFYDEKAGMFLADRYIEGMCPYCKAEGTRSDQCDKCGRLLQQGELIDPISKVTKTTPVIKKTRHLFLDLPEIESQLSEWIVKASKEGKWSENSIHIAKAWLKEGLRKRAITRDLKWGVQVPLPGYEKKVFYVWFDAPIGYISILANLTEDWEAWWKDKSEEVKLYQFMGKDNVPFHTVIFPSTLMGTKQPWTLLHHISTTEFLNYEGGKFSKSRQVGVFGDDAMKSGIQPDVWRYYLLANRPEQADTNFTWEDFADKNNNELLANIGNLVNRTLVFVKNNFGGEIPPQSAKLTDVDIKFIENQKKVIDQITADLENVKLKDGLHKIILFSKNANKYFQDNKPWESIWSDKVRCQVVIGILADQVKDLSILLGPYLPHISSEIQGQLKIDNKSWADLGKVLESGHKIGEVRALVQKIEKQKINEIKAKFAAKAGWTTTSAKEIRFTDLDLEVGEILSVEKHPQAEKLFVEMIRLADGERQIVSGLVGHYLAEELVGKKVLIVKNLAAAKLRGVESAGMILAAEGHERAPMHDGKAPMEQDAVEVLFADKSSVGDKVFKQGEEGLTKSNKPTITIKEFEKVAIEVKNFDVVCEGEVLATSSGEKITMKNIKEGVVG